MDVDSGFDRSDQRLVKPRYAYDGGNLPFPQRSSEGRAGGSVWQHDRSPQRQRRQQADNKGLRMMKW